MNKEKIIKNSIEASKIFKALSEPIRLEIINILSCQEMCACDLLEGLSISQSTLSHHMKVLMQCGLVLGRKDATWMHYIINQAGKDSLHGLIDEFMNPKKDCICYSLKEKDKKIKKERCINERKKN